MSQDFPEQMTPVGQPEAPLGWDAARIRQYPTAHPGGAILQTPQVLLQHQDSISSFKTRTHKNVLWR